MPKHFPGPRKKRREEEEKIGKRESNSISQNGMRYRMAPNKKGKGQSLIIGREVR